MLAVEFAASPTLTRGKYAYHHADYGGLYIMLRMYNLGHGSAHKGIRAGAMRYPGTSPLVSALYQNKQIEARPYSQTQAFEAAITFAKAGGLIPSLECSYAVKAVIDKAIACKSRNEKKNILFLLDANSKLKEAKNEDSTLC